MQNRSTPLNGQRLIEQGYTIHRDDIGTVLRTPSGEIKDAFQLIHGLGLCRRVWALEAINAIESEIDAGSRFERKAKRTGDRLDIKGMVFESAPTRNRLK